jgi:hypothetical protein
MTLSATLLGVMAIGIAVSLILLLRRHSASQAVRWGLLSVIGGLLGYDLYAMGVPSALKARNVSEKWGATLVAILGCLVMNLIGAMWDLVWRRVRQERSDHSVE